MISESIGVPFPRNQLPSFHDSIMHGHYLNPLLMKDVVVLWRDGRDVLVSQYYHSLFKNEKGNARLVDLYRNNLNFKNYDDIETNLPAFIEFVFSRKVSPKFNWTEFVDHWVDRNDFIHVKYEDLRSNTLNELDRILFELTGNRKDKRFLESIVHKYSFENQSGRKPGEESTRSFMRKGVVGDWKNHFSREAKELFQYYAGESLIKLGYEQDGHWVDDE